jgi:uncharacterized membrane protein
VNENIESFSPNREDRLMAGLAYPFWFVVFPLVYMTPDKRNNPFLRFHSYQGAALGLWGVCGLSLFRALLSMFVRWFILLDVLLYPVMKMLEWGVLAFVIYGAVWAYRGKYAELPFLSDFVRSLTGDKVQDAPGSPDQGEEN